MGIVYDKVHEFMKRYPGGIYWLRQRLHSKVIQTHLNTDEEILYAFAGQKNDKLFDIFSSATIVLTNKRILFGQKRLLFGYALTAITPDLFNDMQVYQGVFWEKLSLIQLKNA